MTEEQVELLRKFDLTAAEPGDKLCWRDGRGVAEYIGPCASHYVDDVCIRWISWPKHDEHDVELNVCIMNSSSNFRQLPLCWIKDRPAYIGDKIYDEDLGEQVIVGIDREYLRIASAIGQPWRLADPKHLGWPPRRVKRSGWINVAKREPDCKTWVPEVIALASHVYATREDAEKYKISNVSDQVYIEWEENV